MNRKKINKAKQVLKDAGYFTDNLWHVDDVKIFFECTDEEAQGVLKYALTGEGTFNTIWEAIEDGGDYKELKKKLETKKLKTMDKKKCYIACNAEPRDFIARSKDVDGFVKHIMNGYAVRGKDFELKKFHMLENVHEVLDFSNPYLAAVRISNEDYDKILLACELMENPPEKELKLIYQIYKHEEEDRFICVGYGESGRIEHLNFQQGLDHMDKEMLFTENERLIEILRAVVLNRKENTTEEEVINQTIELYVDAFILGSKS